MAFRFIIDKYNSNVGLNKAVGIGLNKTCVKAKKYVVEVQGIDRLEIVHEQPELLLAPYLVHVQKSIDALSRAIWLFSNRLAAPVNDGIAS